MSVNIIIHNLIFNDLIFIKYNREIKLTLSQLSHINYALKVKFLILKQLL